MNRDKNPKALIFSVVGLHYLLSFFENLTYADIPDTGMIFYRVVAPIENAAWAAGDGRGYHGVLPLVSPGGEFGWIGRTKQGHGRRMHGGGHMHRPAVRSQNKA